MSYLLFIQYMQLNKNNVYLRLYTKHFSFIKNMVYNILVRIHLLVIAKGEKQMFMRMPHEISQQLYEDEIVYRPPLEAYSILIDVAFGCPWSRCTFCREEVRKRYRVSDLENIHNKIVTLSTLPGIEDHKTAFLLGENGISLPLDFLLGIFADIHKYLPQVEQINMYGRVKETLDKGEDGMRQLKDAGLGDMYIGVESGSEQIIKNIRKGTNLERMKRCFDMLDKLGITYALSSIIGLGGKELSEENAIETARFYNSIHPKSIRIMSLTPVEGSTLYKQIQEGLVTELTPAEILKEKRLFIENLEVDNCLLVGTHISNNVPLMGNLQKDKARILTILDEAIATHDEDHWHKRDFENM
jgi:radical SAM superfamily enzyme YgiQ (UPF0313 family)